MKLPNIKISKIAERVLGKRKSEVYTPLIIVNLLMIVFQTVYIFLRISYVNPQIPFWYSKFWGDYQLVPKNYLYILPVTSFILLGISYLLILFLGKYFIRYVKEVTAFFVSIWNLSITVSLVRIIFIASSPFPPIINPSYLNLLIPFLLSFTSSSLLLPLFTNYVKSKDLITNPTVHAHPAMILQRPTARGGGFFYGLLFLVFAIFFVGLPRELIGFYISIVMVSVLGILDDYQNTHPKSNYRALENPALRLILLFAAVSTVILSGIRIPLISNPFGAPIDLNTYTIMVGNVPFPYISVIISMIWVVWILNLLSWSNGIDGQYAGIIGISSIIIGILALRFDPIQTIHTRVAIMSMVSAGLAFGFVRQTWYPSKILWGFGAVSAGMVIAILSILVNSKVVVSVLIILIPFMDAIVTVFRRIIQRKNPLAGDKGHLHHLLLSRGWSVPKVALFYWLTTAVFGVIGIISSEKYIVQVGLTVIGAVGFIIVLMNLKSARDKKLPRQLE